MEGKTCSANAAVLGGIEYCRAKRRCSFEEFWCRAMGKETSDAWNEISRIIEGKNDGMKTRGVVALKQKRVQERWEGKTKGNATGAGTNHCSYSRSAKPLSIIHSGSQAQPRRWAGDEQRRSRSTQCRFLALFSAPGYGKPPPSMNIHSHTTKEFLA